MAKAILNERDKDIIASIENSESILLGSAHPSSEAIESLTERLKQNHNEFAPEAIGKILFYISRSEQPEQAADAMASIVNSKDLDPIVRQDAISALGLLPPEYADLPLAAALEESNDIKESIVLKALARAGDKAGLKKIKSLPPTANTRLLNLRAYAETMIALRLGETISRDVERMTLPKTTPFKINEENIETLKETIKGVEGKPFGLTFNEDLGYSFDCANCKHTILVNANIKRGALLRTTAQSQIAAIIVMEDKERGRHVLRHSVLLRADKKKTYVSVLRTNGEVALAGELRPNGDNLELYLRDVGTVVRPIQISGKISNDQVEIKAEAFSSLAKVKLTGLPIN